MSLKTKRQDRQTQRMFDNVTKNLLDQGNGLKRDPETGILYEEPLKEEHPVGSLLLLRGAGPAAAKGLEFIGEKMMPSAFLKGVGQTFPKLAKATTAISPYADAGLLATWGAQGIQSAKEAAKSGDAAGVIAGASIAALPLMGINPEAARELTTTQKANKVARALNKEVKPLSSPISEAERLGIPKGERSNPKALEDPQYWGYKQWNDRYNAAVESGNWDEVQKLRDLHFKTKAPNTKVIDENGNPLHMYHGIKPEYKHIGTRVSGSNYFKDQIYWDKPVRFTKFRYINFDLEDLAEESKRNWVSMKKAVPNHDTMNGYHTRSYEEALRAYGRNNPSNVLDNYLNIEKPFKWDAQTLRNITGRSEASDWADFGWDRKKLMELGYDGLFIPQYHDSYGVFNSPAQIKSADPITWNGKGEIIPIVKRDNFHNLDMRYKQGGILKGSLQNNKELI